MRKVEEWSGGYCIILYHPYLTNFKETCSVYFCSTHDNSALSPVGSSVPFLHKTNSTRRPRANPFRYGLYCSPRNGLARESPNPVTLDLRESVWTFCHASTQGGADSGIGMMTTYGVSRCTPVCMSHYWPIFFSYSPLPGMMFLMPPSGFATSPR